MSCCIGSPKIEGIKFKGLLDQVSGTGIKFEDELLGLFLLISLPQSWETFQISVTSSAPKCVVSLETAKGGILNEEMRKAQGTSSQSEVLVTENKGRSQKKELKGGGENNISKSKGRYKNMKCHYFHMAGHIQKKLF
jgi:hypothetical protein